MSHPDKSIRELSCADDYDPNSMPVDKARQFIRTFLQPVSGLEQLHIRAALGRVLAADIVSPVDVPAHDNSAMDGYAVRYADLDGRPETRLKLIGSSFAGVPVQGEVGPGECVRIMTGGVVPAGTDTIVMQEHVQNEASMIKIGAGHRKHQNLRRAGEDLKTGQTALSRGTPLRPAELGLIASLGIGEIAVYRKLRVAFFSTGDELRSVGSKLGPGEIYDSNRYTIYGMLARLGIDAIDMGVVRDDPASLEQSFAAAAAVADVVITSGGVSVGEADFVKELLERLGEVV